MTEFERRWSQTPGGSLDELLDQVLPFLQADKELWKDLGNFDSGDKTDSLLYAMMQISVARCLASEELKYLLSIVLQMRQVDAIEDWRHVERACERERELGSNNIPFFKAMRH
jgi:hypothetical protein